MKSEQHYLFELLEELENAEKKGISLTLEGYPSSPMQIMKACMVREEGSYMRDYLSDDDGNLSELRFDKITDS